MKSYKSYKKLRTSYQQVTKSYEQLQKVTNELPGDFKELHFAKFWKNGLPIRAPRQAKTKNQLRGSDRFRSSQKPFHRKNTPLSSFYHPPQKITKTHSGARFVATLRKHPRKGWLVAHSFFSCFSPYSTNMSEQKS